MPLKQWPTQRAHPPPVNDNDDEYASPMTADGVGQAVITNPPPTITSNWRSPWLPAESATRAVMRKVPEALGVPPICPVAEFRLTWQAGLRH